MKPAPGPADMGEWVAVKHCWGRKVDSTDKAALTRLVASCPNVRLTVKKR